MEADSSSPADIRTATNGSVLSQTQTTAGAAQKHSNFRLMFAIAFGSVCVIWGSTYIAVRFMIETMPAFISAGTRFLLAGALMLAWLRWRGVQLPSRTEWVSCGIVGLFLVVGGNGGLTLAMKYIPSSVGSIIGASLPMWMTLLDWLRPNGRRPATGVFVGLVLGFLGIVLLVQPWNAFSAPSHGAATTNHTNAPHINLWGVMLACSAVFAWAAGSIFSRQTTMPASALMGTAAQMLTGGAVMLILGAMSGELSGSTFSAISVKSLVSWVYLIIFGSVVAFSAYAWLLNNVSPTLASSYTYINPLIAVMLGWWLGGEAITSQMLLSGAVIIAAVIVIAKYRSQSAQAVEVKTAPDTVTTTRVNGQHGQDSQHSAVEATCNEAT